MATMTPELSKNLINGQWVEAKSGQTMPTVNPATGEILGHVPRSGPEDVVVAVAAAKEAYGRWRRIPAPRRAEILYGAAERLVEEKDSLARLMTQEMGKVLTESRGDVQEAIDMTYFVAGEGRRLHGYTTPSEMPHKMAYCIRVPVGVVGVITPWNFPMAIPSWKIIPALVCGNTVVFKPATYTPLVALRFAQILQDAGLPPGVLNVVTGAGGTVGDTLVDHPDVAIISFTGSTETGLTIAEKCARRGKRVSLEMGGKNAAIVLDDADLQLVTDSLIWSAFGTTGQRCTACSRIISERGAQKELTERLVERTRTLRMGDGLLAETEVGPLVSDAQRSRVHEYVEVGKKEGARLLVGGRSPEEGSLDRGAFYAPTIFDRVTPGMRIAREEIFGPVTDILEAKDLEDAIRILNNVEYGLSASLFTRDINRAMRAIEEIDTGIVYINHGTIGAEVHLPFGGTKRTGNGHREGGLQVLDVFSEWKTVYVDYSGRLQRAQIDKD